uniref:Uncharacterized protein n=1 Tax=Knipowitschia caucasica TaxID=637954 RepID=A0AAV2L277_KNICA
MEEQEECGGCVPAVEVVCIESGLARAKGSLQQGSLRLAQLLLASKGRGRRASVKYYNNSQYNHPFKTRPDRARPESGFAQKETLWGMPLCRGALPLPWKSIKRPRQRAHT